MLRRERPCSKIAIDFYVELPVSEGFYAIGVVTNRFANA